MTAISKCIAERKWIAVDPAGNEHNVRLCIMSPIIGPDGSATCLTDVGFGSQPVTIFGDDSWQAVRLAMSFCTDELRSRISSGWSFFWPDSRDVASDDDLL